MELQQSRMLIAAALAGLLLTGCAGSGDQVASLLVAPGKYQFYNCAQLAVATCSTAERERKLEDLMAKAQTGAGGQVVSAAAYQPDYLVARGEMNELRRAARDKHCDLSGDAATQPPANKPAAAH